jgi:aminoglycoside 6'-N-acetyltransferase I
MEYVKADATHVNAIATLASLLWHEDDYDSIEDLQAQFADIINDKNSAVFLCRDGGADVGFAQFALRFDYVEGTHKRPVGYLEGVYVREQYRKRGIARHFIQLGELWAHKKGCSQLASDCELANTDSLKFHLKSGFSEANRVICFVKDITTTESN